MTNKDKLMEIIAKAEKDIIYANAKIEIANEMLKDETEESYEMQSENETI